MSAHHFFTDRVDGDTVTLTGDDASHARRALRIRAGEMITVGDGAGTIVEACVTGVATVLTADVLARRMVPAPVPRVIVFPAVPKSGKLEMVVQKLTELGVDEIVPWFAARTVVRWDAEKARAHGERLRAIAREAAKQSRRAWLPLVRDPAPLDGLPPVTLVLHEEATDLLRAALPDAAPDAAGVVIGPEGGLEPAEAAGLVARGARAVTLGPQILRTETASLVASALLLARYGRLG